LGWIGAALALYWIVGWADKKEQEPDFDEELDLQASDNKKKQHENVEIVGGVRTLTAY
jgi:beta-lactamase class D